MILIGQYDSPFVRRVAVALQFYGVPCEHRPWSVFGDAEAIARFNPLRRVPTLVLDDGEALFESAVILDALDDLVGPDRALVPRSGAPRREVLRIAAAATGLADKAVSHVYERKLKDAPSERWLLRCETQMTGMFEYLEAQRARRSTPFWMGDAVTHADVAVTCVLRFTREALGGRFEHTRWPRIAELAQRCEALPQFGAVVQPLALPA